MTSLAQSARATLTDYRPDDDEQAALREHFLTVLADPAAVGRERHPAHLTAGVLVVSRDRTEVLLNLHRKAGIWVHFGGHLEPDDASVRDAAIREGREESGLPSFDVTAEPAQLSSHRVDFCHPDGVVDHLDVRYVAVADRVEPVCSEESTDIRWWPVDQVPTRERELLDLIARARL